MKLSANDEFNTTFDDAVGEYKIVPGAVLHGRPFYVHKDDAALVMLYAGEYFFYMKHKIRNKKATFSSMECLDDKKATSRRQLDW